VKHKGVTITETVKDGVGIVSATIAGKLRTEEYNPSDEAGNKWAMAAIKAAITQTEKEAARVQGVKDQDLETKRIKADVAKGAAAVKEDIGNPHGGGA